MTYWTANGRFQDVYNILYAALVPKEGDADSEIGQILRYASRIYYDIYNNGAMNFPALSDARGYLKRRTEKFLQTAEELHVEDFDQKLSDMLSSRMQKQKLDKRTAQELEEVIDVIINYVQLRFDKEYIKPQLNELVTLLQRHPPKYTGQTKADFDRLIEKISSVQETVEI